ncbi:Ankyrin repeat and SAM domain-containing protein 3 [Hondaea fermentalgiana]|uniref:Ankyrin repeat and SAM domain-containing protein 3 n=1 Tax=Hondaea fermentalgiana TaxID=2315210 RepID=A0A2R5GK73_9STRA|nr:Ankyrin repeat and SAM domain-containing protein 3 [Hondaea fermentalgiana]|eukprot:GBG30719.1 Ankyrin repeat and SAM domain-containing protein 3 [Hondaea fermentalgiana]
MSSPDQAQTPLMRALDRGRSVQLQEIESIFAHDPLTLNAQDEDGWTALMYACRYAHPQAANFLIRNHAKTNIQSRDGFTAIMLAVRSGQREIVTLLEKNNADLSMRTKNGYSALMLASCDPLEENHKAEDLAKCVKVCWASGADANLREANGFDALKLAKHHGCKEVVSFLTFVNGQETDLAAPFGSTLPRSAIKKKVKTWFDGDQLEHSLSKEMAAGIDASHVFIVFVTERYMLKLMRSERLPRSPCSTGSSDSVATEQSDASASTDDTSSSEGSYSAREFKYAISMRKTVIPVVLEPSMLPGGEKWPWQGPLNFDLGDPAGMMRSFLNLTGSGDDAAARTGRGESRLSSDEEHYHEDEGSLAGSVRHHRLWSRSDRKLGKDEAMKNSIRDLTANDLHIIRALDEKRKHALLNFDVDRRELDRLAVLLRARLHLSVHRRLIHAYEDCFRGVDAVSWLVSNSVCTDPEDAKNVLRHLLYRRIILRIDHTKPLLNSAIHSMAPSLAEWRRRKQLDWYQTGVQKYSMGALYTFNVGAFAKYKLVVRLVAGRGLRYTRHNRILGRWEPKRIAPLASVTLGSITANTSVEEKTSEPRWDESFTFYFDYTLPRHDEVWIKVFDFRELGESFPLGVVCVPTKRILKQCRVSADRIPPIFAQDAPGWLSWHPLLPPATAREPDEVRGGELQIEFQVITNIVDTPDATVHDECRPKREEVHSPQDTVDPEAHSRLDSDHHRDRSPSTLPRSVMQYQHVDRRPEKEIYAQRALLDAQQEPHEPSTVSRKAKAASPDQNTRNAAQTQEFSVPVERWQTCITSLEIRDVTDVAPGTVTWIEVLAHSPKRSAHLAKRRAEASKGKRRDMENDTGVIARKRSPRFLWPKDGRPVVKAGAVNLPIPDDVAKYTILEFRLVRRKDLLTSVVCGRGKMNLQYIRRTEDLDSDSDSDADDDDSAFDDDDEDGVITRVETEVDLDRSEVDLDSVGLQRRLAPSKTQDSLPTSGGSTVGDEDDKSQIPSVDDLKPQPPIDPTHQDAHFVVLRKQAAFKRNIKIKCGQIYCYAKMRPLLHDEDHFDIDESLSIVDPAQDANIDIEDALKAVVSTNADDVPKPIEIPAPLTNLYVDETVPGTVQQIALALLGTNSKFAMQFAKERKNTNVVVGPWKLPDDESQDAGGGGDGQGNATDGKNTAEQEETDAEAGSKRLANPAHETASVGKASNASANVESEKDTNDSESSLTDLPEGSIRGMFKEKASSTAASRRPLSVTTRSEQTIRVDNDNDDDAAGRNKAKSEAQLMPGDEIARSPSDPVSAAPSSANDRNRGHNNQAGKTGNQGSSKAPSTKTSASPEVAKEASRGEGSKSRPPLARQESIHAMQAGKIVDSVTYPTRTLTFTIPASSLTKSSDCTEVQRIVRMDPGGFIFTSTGETPGVPYGERFYVHVQFAVAYVSPTESRVCISGEVRYYEGKPPPTFPIKGFILSGVKSGHTDAYTHEIKMLRDYLLAKNRQSRTAKPAKKSKTEQEPPAPPSKPSALERAARFLRLVLALVLGTLTLYLVFVVLLAAFQDRTARDVLRAHRALAAARLGDLRHALAAAAASSELI